MGWVWQMLFKTTFEYLISALVLKTVVGSTIGGGFLAQTFFSRCVFQLGHSKHSKGLSHFHFYPCVNVFSIRLCHLFRGPLEMERNYRIGKKYGYVRVNSTHFEKVCTCTKYFVGFLLTCIEMYCPIGPIKPMLPTGRIILSFSFVCVYVHK